jgi:thiol-disulfide isomerase/thioredoxin
MELYKKHKYCLPVLVFFVLQAVAGCSSSKDPESSPPTGIVEMSKEGRQMPAFKLPSPLSDESITISNSLQGKVVLVSFFASWCRSCLEEIPLLKKLQTRFGPKDFAIIAMAVDEENEVGLKNLIQKQKINYQVLLADEAVKKDFGGIAILPTMFLVNREGILLKKYSGHIDRDSLIQDIKQTLKI